MSDKITKEWQQDERLIQCDSKEMRAAPYTVQLIEKEGNESAAAMVITLSQEHNPRDKVITIV